jgi:hypothetical protein
VTEQHLKRKLTPMEIVHHLDGDGGNNELSNLQLMERNAHAKHHGVERHAAALTSSVCTHCNKSVACLRSRLYRYARSNTFPFCSSACIGYHFGVGRYSKAYSADALPRFFAQVDAGLSYKQLCAEFGIGACTVSWRKRHRSRLLAQVGCLDSTVRR